MSMNEGYVCLLDRDRNVLPTAEPAQRVMFAFNALPGIGSVEIGVDIDREVTLAVPPGTEACYWGIVDADGQLLVWVPLLTYPARPGDTIAVHMPMTRA